MNRLLRLLKSSLQPGAANRPKLDVRSKRLFAAVRRDFLESALFRSRHFHVTPGDRLYLSPLSLERGALYCISGELFCAHPTVPF